MAKTKTPAEPSTASKLIALVDDLGEVHERLERVDGLRKIGDDLRKQILFLVGEFDPTLPKHLDGKFYAADISARRNETKVNCKALVKQIGLNRFLAICSVTQGALADTLPGAAAVDFLATTQTGPRVITTGPKPDSPDRKL